MPQTIKLKFRHYPKGISELEYNTGHSLRTKHNMINEFF